MDGRWTEGGRELNFFDGHFLSLKHRKRKLIHSDLTRAIQHENAMCSSVIKNYYQIKLFLIVLNLDELLLQLFQRQRAVFQKKGGSEQL